MELTRTIEKTMVKKKMQKQKLNDLSYEKHGELQVRKEGTSWVWYYRSHPSTYETVKNVVCTWSHGIATIPESWLE